MTESRPPRPAPKPGRVTVYRAMFDYTAQGVSYVVHINVNNEGKGYDFFLLLSRLFYVLYKV